MKHLPNELLYLLKVYNYITHDIGLDRARSHAEDIRNYIAKADFLDAYPTVREYLSEDKSIDDIITYIQRNERTYSLLGEWRDREITALFEEKGVQGAFGIVGDFSVKKEGSNAYFVIPRSPCTADKIVLLNADISEDIYIEEVLWLEFYRSRDGMCLEIFDNNCNTAKTSFCDFECRKVFYSALPLSEGCKSVYESVVKMASFIYEKYEYDSSLLNDDETALLPVITFFADVSNSRLNGTYPHINSLFSEYGLEKCNKLLKAIALSESDKKTASLTKQLIRLLKSSKCRAFLEKINSDIKSSQD